MRPGSLRDPECQRAAALTPVRMCAAIRQGAPHTLEEHTENGPRLTPAILARRPAIQARILAAARTPDPDEHSHTHSLTRSLSVLVGIHSRYSGEHAPTILYQTTARYPGEHSRTQPLARPRALTHPLDRAVPWRARTFGIHRSFPRGILAQTTARNPGERAHTHTHSLTHSLSLSILYPSTDDPLSWFSFWFSTTIMCLQAGGVLAGRGRPCSQVCAHTGSHGRGDRGP